MNGDTIMLIRNIGEGSSNEKATGFHEYHSSGFFLNSCAVIPMIAGGGTLACSAWDTVTEGTERCPALVEIDENLKN